MPYFGLASLTDPAPQTLGATSFPCCGKASLPKVCRIFLIYDLETKTMTLRLSIRAGAAVGAPPSEPGRWMYSVLQARWVRRAAPVAPPKTLLTEPRVCEGVLAAYCL